MNYLDTSALIKRFVSEKGSPVILTLIKRNEPIATAKIAYAEIYAGLTSKLREGGLSSAQYALACRQFESDWNAYLRIELQDTILLRARDLIKRHPLRGFDAVHLASALNLKDILGEEMTFVAADERLLRAAKSERLGILNPETAQAARP